MSDSSASSDYDNVDTVSEYDVEDEEIEDAQLKTVASGEVIVEEATKWEKSDSQEFDYIAYADEPLASEEWVAEYNKELRKEERRANGLQRRFDGTNTLESW